MGRFGDNDSTPVLPQSHSNLWRWSPRGLPQHAGPGEFNRACRMMLASKEGRNYMTRGPAVLLCTMLAIGLVPAFSQTVPPPSTLSVAKELRDNFVDVDRRLLDMAKDWPADKYDYKLKPEMRSFGTVLVHVASGNVYAAKKGRGENVKWDELDPAKYPDKASVVALLEKSFAESEAVLAKLPPESFAHTVEPWLDVLEHSGEHYGLLVAYYRANGVVPPESRPKK